MRVSTRLDPIQRDIDLILAEDLSPEGRSRMLASYAREQLEDAQDVNQRALGSVPPHETFVDGRQDAPLEGVRPDGTILFEFALVEDVLVWIGEQLARHAPFLTGRFSESITLFADGTEITPGEPIPSVREYVYLSTVPYARKIERGQSAQAPEGVFEVIAAMASRRFGNIARISFSYRSPFSA